MCHKKYRTHLARHIKDVHKVQRAKAQQLAVLQAKKAKAEAFSSGFGAAPRNVSEETCRAVFGDMFDRPGFREKLSVVLDKVGATIGEQSPPQEDVAAESESGGERDSSSEEEEADENLKTKSLVKRYLPYKAPSNSPLMEAYSDFVTLSAKSTASSANKIANFSRYLGFALHESKASPEKEMQLMVNVDLAKKFIKTLEFKCKAAPATIYNYVKAVKGCLDNAAGFWPQLLPKGAIFRDKMRVALNTWKLLLTQWDRKYLDGKNQKLAEGNVNRADMGTCEEYFEDQAVRNRVNCALKRLAATKRTSTTFQISRESQDNKDWMTVIGFLMSKILVSNSVRSGVVQNLTIPEFLAAKGHGRAQSEFTIFVRTHKTSDKGVAAITVTKEDHRMMVEYLKLREALRTKVKSNRLFVTQGGLVVRSLHKDLNAWLKARRLPPITTNMIRKAVQTSAEEHPVEVQNRVSSALGHSSNTANLNYRAVTSREALRRHQAVRFVSLNALAMKLFESRGEELFPDADLPPRDEVEKLFRRELKSPRFKLSDATYASMLGLWEA